MAFKLLGPEAIANGTASQLLSEGEEWMNGKEKRSFGRNAARDEDAKEQNTERDFSAGQGASPFKRGIAMGATRKDLAILFQKEEEARENKRANNIFSLSQELASKNNRLSTLIKLLDKVQGTTKEHLEAKIMKTIEAAEKIESDMEEARKPRKSKRPNVARAFINTGTQGDAFMLSSDEEDDRKPAAKVSKLTLEQDEKEEEEEYDDDNNDDDDSNN
jgi:hypothetical protein